MEIIIKPLPRLTDKEYQACRRLNMGPEGLMQDTLIDQADNPRCQAIMLWGRYMYGWALLEPIKETMYAEVSDHAMRVCKYSAQFYVRESARGRGYGRMLMNEVVKFDPKPYCIPHDPLSGSFFSNFRITATRDRRELMSKKKVK